MRKQRRKAHEFVDGRTARTRRLKRDLGIQVKSWRRPCMLRHPKRLADYTAHRDLGCGIDYKLLDHGITWWRGGHLLAVVTEPYDPEGEEVAALTASCVLYGLDVHISGEHAVHFPPYTLAVIVTRAGDRLQHRDKRAG
ncbi:hypothetical protein ACIBG7_27260 [Nonomuraea sp. NPDC050328]|uniref:hypothetical protein n=1 Tax=Nonomuraea sp. NPDC050328 TaxID=3364361 RepID=UPI00379EB151